jgi:hypothetical protein
VLQVLALVQRRGAEAGGAAADLGRLAGQQEAALRALVGSGTGSTAAAGAPGAPGNVDLRTVMLSAQTDRVTVSVPAQAVLLPKAAADELASATRAALDNVRRHCGDGTRAWVLVEDEPGLVTVTIRDDGPGIADGRLAEAVAAGRLGVSHSIRGRLRDLGGSASISSVPGDGTEVELRLRHARNFSTRCGARPTAMQYSPPGWPRSSLASSGGSRPRPPLTAGIPRV